jgi:hypothetical protein
MGSQGLLSARYLVSDVRSRPYTLRTDDALKVRFSATLGDEQRPLRAGGPASRSPSMRSHAAPRSDIW